jgi:ribulose-phosphate 3-epimerase
MCADACRLGEEVRTLEDLGADSLHFDLMDGHFVPNMPMGLGILAALRGKTHLPFDVHLMVEKNDWFIEEIAKIGAEQISVHAESAVHLDRSLALIRSHGIRAGVALNPATPLSALDYVVDRLDVVLLMTVNPGFAGQTLVPATLQKIADCRACLGERGSRALIEVDGNVSFENVPEMVAAGADILVAGSSSLYSKGASLRQNMERLRASGRDGLQRRSLRAGGAGGGAPAGAVLGAPS